MANQTVRYTSQQVAAEIGIPYGTLMYWVRMGLLAPAGSGSGKKQALFWSEKDLSEARGLADSRDSRLNVKSIGGLMNHLRAVGDPISR